MSLKPMYAKLISFSLYGDDPKYLMGAIRNACLVPLYYPGWQMRVYCADDVDANELQRLGCQIERMGVSHDHSGMLWRFLPAWEEGVDRVIFRDADSRLGPREAAAVAAWEASGLDTHAMHDHLFHGCLPIFGGMWGVRGGVLPNIMSQWTRYMSSMQRRVEDMHILRLSILPHIKNSVLRHSSVPVQWPSLPFPNHAPQIGFVGQQCEADDRRIWPALPK